MPHSYYPAHHKKIPAACDNEIVNKTVDKPMDHNPLIPKAAPLENRLWIC